MVTDKTPNIPQQILKSEAKIKENIQDNIQKESAPVEYRMERKSIFTDHRGVLIAQIKDHTGEVIANYPSNEVIKRYHSLKENL